MLYGLQIIAAGLLKVVILLEDVSEFQDLKFSESAVQDQTFSNNSSSLFGSITRIVFSFPVPLRTFSTTCGEKKQKNPQHKYKGLGD